MAIDLDVHGNTRPLEAAVQAAVNRIRRKPIQITVDDKGATQPLGNMKRAADEFSKSMEAANARILAFGASMAIINGVADAFKGMVRNLVEVEKSLADINVVMGLSTQNLDKFSDGLFKVAKETGAAFRVAADAATEYARQGLSVEESLKRTRDALVLTRLTGMDSAEAVKSLTAAMNTYGKQIKDTTQLVSKFAAVDVQFAVSAEDFAAAISRTGQAAKSAGVDIDELIGIVTSAQQQTARGGAVIGNALKTIFTKTGRTDTLNQLENLGIAVRDLEGNTIGARRILTDLANTFDHLSEAQKAQITQTMGGLFHINILKAVLSDAAKQNGILAKATQISSSATDEAIQKNEQLRQTMSAMATETGLAIKELSVQIGELMLAPGMEKILNAVKGIAESATDILDGEGAGSKFANGFLKGLGNIITGPGLVVLSAVFIKLFGTAVKFTKESLTSLIGVTSEAQKQKAIQTTLVGLLGRNAALSQEMLRTDISRTEKEKILLGLLQAQTAEANKLNAISKQLAGTLYTKGYGPGLTQGKRRAYGHIPNFADPERAQAARGGYAAGNIRSMNMPGEGPIIYNSAETVKNFAGFKQPAIMPPQSSKAGKNYQQAFGSIHGFDPYAAGGYIPNFALKKPFKKSKFSRETEDLTIEEAFSRGINKNTIRTAFGQETYDQAKLTFTSDLKNKPKVTPASGLANTPINLNEITLTKSKVNDMGVLLGYGKEGLSYPKYSQPFSSLPEGARKRLLPYMGPKGLKKMPKQDSGHWKRKVEVTLPTKAVYAVSEDDAARMEEAVGADTLKADLKRSIGPGFDRFSSKIGQKLFGSKSKKSGINVLEEHVLSDGSALGALFEAGVRGALNNKALTGAEQQRAFDFMGDNAQRLSDKFMGIGKRYYIEAKKDLGAASKGDIPKKVLNAAAAFIGPMKPGAAGGYIPNFAANSWESEPKWKWSMNPDYIAFQKKKNQEELNKRISKFGNSNISLTGKYSGNLPIARITDPQTGTYTDFTYGKGSGETSNSASIIYSSRGKQDQKGGAFRNFGILGDFTSKQGGKDRSIYSDFDQINVAAGKSPWAMVLRAFPQLKQRIKPGMVTSGEMNIGHDTLPFNSLRSLKMQVSKWVKQNGLQAFLDYSKANLGFNEKNAILSGTSSGDLFSIGGLRTRMLTRRDKNYLNDSKVGFAASGYIPNFADPLSDAIGREKAAGVPVSQIRVGSHSALMSKGNPLGLGVTNTHDEPNGLRDVFGANGFVPNYAVSSSTSDFSAINAPWAEGKAKRFNKLLDRFTKQFEQGTISFKELHARTKRMAVSMKMNSGSMDNLLVKQNDSISAIDKLNAKRRGLMNSLSRQNQRFAGGRAGQALSGNAGMALMMGLPMAAGFIRGDDPTSSTRSSLAGAMEGVGTGASIGMMFGPLGTALGAAAGGLFGFVKGLDEAEEAVREKAKAEREAFINQRSASVQQGLSQAIGQIATQEISNVFTAKNLAEFKSGTEARHYAGTNRMGGSEYEGMQLLERLQASDFFDQFGQHSGGRISMVDILKPGAISGFSMGGVEGLREKDAKQVAEAYAQQMALMQGIQSLPSGTRIQSGEDKLSKKQFLEKISSYDFGDENELKKFQEDVKNARKVFEDTSNAESERKKAVILQLDIQKIMLESQKRAKEAQFNISASMQSQASNLSLMEKTMGGFATEQQKAQLKYIGSINKAAETYASSAQQAESAFESSMLSILKDEDVKSKVKTALAKRIKQRGGGDVDANKLDVSDEFLKLSQKERKEMYTQLKLGDDITKNIENQVTVRQNALSLAEKQVNQSRSIAQAEFSVNEAIARRKDLISDMKTSAGIGAETVGSTGRIRAMDAQVAAAERLGALGPGYQTSADQEAFQMEEKRIALQNKSLEIREQADQKMNDELIKLANLKMQEAELVKLKSFVGPEKPEDAEKRLRDITALEATEGERKKQQEEILGSVERINKEAEKEVSTAEKLLQLEEKRLKAKRAHETGPGAFGNGMTDAFTRMREQVTTMDYELGQKIPFAFADGLANAMTEAFNGTKNIKDGLMDAAVSFLGMIQQAMMQKAVYSIVGGMPFSRGGNVRNYSKGGGVPARVSNGEYVMGRDAVAKYGGSFMHSLNAGGKIPGYSNGGAPGSALASGFGGGRGHESGRAYQSRAMSSFFYSQSGNVGLAEDTSAMMGILQEEERKRQEAEARRQAKKAKRRQLIGSLVGIAAAAGLNFGAEKGLFGKGIQQNALRPTAGFQGPMMPKYLGGPIRKYASGGYISGKSGIDQIPAMLSEGEYVIRASSARQLGKPMLDRINAGKFNEGGAVSELMSGSETGTSGGNTNNINISINMERGSGSKKETSGQDKTGQNPADRSSDEQNNAALAERIKQQVVAVIVEEQRPGGLLDEKS